MFSLRAEAVYRQYWDSLSNKSKKRIIDASSNSQAPQKSKKFLDKLAEIEARGARTDAERNLIEKLKATPETRYMNQLENTKANREAYYKRVRDAVVNKHSIPVENIPGNRHPAEYRPQYHGARVREPGNPYDIFGRIEKHQGSIVLDEKHPSVKLFGKNLATIHEGYEGIADRDATLKIYNKGKRGADRLSRAEVNDLFNGKTLENRGNLTAENMFNSKQIKDKLESIKFDQKVIKGRGGAFSHARPKVIGDELRMQMNHNMMSPEMKKIRGMGLFGTGIPDNRLLVNTGEYDAYKHFLNKHKDADGRIRPSAWKKANRDMSRFYKEHPEGLPIEELPKKIGNKLKVGLGLGAVGLGTAGYLGYRHFKKSN